jgi:sugar phosphate isomerase/epimerase
MVKAISTYVFVKQRLHPGMLDSLVRAGAGAIEIFCARGHFDYASRQQVREIAAWFSSSGIPLNSLHSPMYSDYEWGRTGTPPISIVDREKKRRVESMDEIKRALEVAEQIPFRFLVQHVGLPDDADDPSKFEFAMSSIEHLHAFAKPLGVQILLENIPNELSTPEKLSELLQSLHIPDLGVCFDTGHANIMSTVQDAFEMLKSHIRSTHVHDNNRDKDAHLWPSQGNINWSETMRLLASAPQVPPILLEINGDDQPDVTSKFQNAFRTLEQAAEVAAG